MSAVSALASPPPCLECGTCCFSNLETSVRVTGDDYERLGDAVDDHVNFVGNRAYMRLANGHCSALRVELDGRFVCTLYERRPDACRDLERGSPNCAGSSSRRRAARARGSSSCGGRRAEVDLRVATCTALPKRDPDEAPLHDAFLAAGVDARWVAWDDPAADWDSPVPTVVRSTWNYARDRDAFLAWAARAARAAPIRNPLDVLAANTHKRYLVELAARGVPVVPTRLVPRGSAARLASLEWPRVVVKPAVGAGSLGVRVFDRDDPAAEAHAAALGAREDVLVQPYQASVDDYGERSLVWIDGELTHAVRKSPRFVGEGEAVTGPFPIADDERRVALAALAPRVERVLYGRVDVVRDSAGAPVVMELELTEPSLFFAKAPGAAERYVAGLVRRVEEAARPLR